LHPDLSFNFYSWELKLYGISGQSRQVLDIEKTTTQLLEKPNYYRGFIYVCGDNVDSMIDFSPRFNVSALKYLSITPKYKEDVIDTIKSWNYLIDQRWKELAINDISILFNDKY